MQNNKTDLYLETHRKVIKALRCKAKDLVGDPSVMKSALEGSFWASRNSKIFMMTNKGKLNMYSPKDGRKYLEKTHGLVYDYETVLNLAKAACADEKDVGPLVKHVFDTVWEQIFDHMKYHQNYNALEMRVDMFAKVGRMEMQDERVRVVYTHTAFEPRLESYDQAVVDDFIEHFPEFKAFLGWLVACRFARDRKRAYLWLHCESDWGKGFLISLLASFDATTEMSVKEIEKIFEGQPAGKSMAEFKRSFALVVDEFKSARSELKQLQNEIALAPKHQLEQRVEIFAKIFMSAEDVPSFASDEGIEDQFGRRFNYYRGEGVLPDRPLFKLMGSAAYFDHLQSFVAEYLNKGVEHYRNKGAAGAEVYADRVMSAFWANHAISKTFTLLTDNLPSLADEFISYTVKRYCAARFNQFGNDREFHQTLVQKKDGAWIMGRPDKVVGEWLDTTMDRSVVGSLKFKRGQIALAAAVGGEKKVFNVGKGRSLKGIKLRLTEDQVKLLGAGQAPLAAVE